MGYDGLQTLHHKIQNINSTKVGLTFKSVDRTLFKWKPLSNSFMYCLLSFKMYKAEPKNLIMKPNHLIESYWVELSCSNKTDGTRQSVRNQEATNAGTANQNCK